MDKGGWFVIGVNVAWFVPFVFFMTRMVLRANRERDGRRRVLETGMPGRAEILSVDEVGPYYSRVPHLQFRLRVEATPPFEAVAKGFFRQIDYPNLQPGKRVDVRYDAVSRAVAVVGDRLV